jgi:hypothetical protein
MAEKGKPKGLKKTGGRKPGSVNKVQRPLREKIVNFAADNLDEVIKAWNEIKEPKDKLKAYIDLCAYALPKLQAVQVDANVTRTSDVEDDLKKLAEEE